MDRNTILSSLISDYQSYSASDARATVEKVLKHSGNSSDIKRRADINREVVLFRFLTGDPIVEVGAIKPIELNQDLEALIYVEQGESHSIKEARYDRLLDLSDQLIDWSTQVSGPDINSNVLTLSLESVGTTQEQNGLLFTTLRFQTILKIQ